MPSLRIITSRAPHRHTHAPQAPPIRQLPRLTPLRTITDDYLDITTGVVSDGNAETTTSAIFPTPTPSPAITTAEATADDYLDTTTGVVSGGDDEETTASAVGISLI